MKPLLLSIALLPSLSFQAYADELKPIGFSIVYDTLKEDFDGFGTFNQQKPSLLAAFHWKCADKKIVHFNRENSKLTLTSLPDNKKLKAEFEFMSKISVDQKSIRFTVQTENLPAANTTSVNIEGELQLSLATKSELLKSDVIRPEVGQKLTIGKDFHLEVSKVGKPNWGDDLFEFELSAKSSWPASESIRFLDAEGNEIEASPRGSSRSNFLGKVSENRSYSCKTKPEHICLEMKMWSDIEQKTVPFKSNINLPSR